MTRDNDRLRNRAIIDETKKIIAIVVMTAMTAAKPQGIWPLCVCRAEDP